MFNSYVKLPEGISEMQIHRTTPQLVKSHFLFWFIQVPIFTHCTSLEPSWLNWLITGVIWYKYMVDINGTSSHLFMGSKLN